MSAVTEGTLLGGRVRYRQFAAGHRSGFEPVLLAAAVPARAGDAVLEGGTGAGAALLCLAHRVRGLRGYGVEIDPALAALANENFKINGMDDFVAVTGNVLAPAAGERFDHAVANPPWHDGAGTVSPDPARAAAHHAEAALLDGWIAGLISCLKPGGTVTLILPSASFSRAAGALRRHGCGAMAMLPLWPRTGRPAKQVIIAGRLGARGPDRVLSGLILHDENGITPEADAILRDGRALTMA